VDLLLNTFSFKLIKQLGNDLRFEADTVRK